MSKRETNGGTWGYEAWLSDRLRDKTRKCTANRGERCIPNREDAACRKCYDQDKANQEETNE